MSAVSTRLDIVYILDRSKDVIKSGGVNIFPIEIEEVLRVESDVEDVAVIGVPDDSGVSRYTQ